MTLSDIGAVDKTIARAAASAAERFSNRPALRHSRDGEWKAMTFAEVGEVVDELALGLVALGLAPGDRICILANTRPEWTLASLAISRTGGVVVPMYPSNSPAECEWVAGNSEATMVICENAGQVAKIAAVRGNLQRVRHVIAMEASGAEGELSFEQLRHEGVGMQRSELERRSAEVTADDPYTIIYTSGTTGPPKGVVLTHGNAASVGEMVQEIGFVEDGDTTYLFLPLAHSFALTVQLASFDVGTEIIYCGGDMTKIVQELGETKPTYLPSVPRIFEKIFALATAAFPDQQRLDRVVDLGLEVRRRQAQGQDVPEALQAAFDELEQTVYRNVRQLFGGRLAKAVSGAAPISADILRFFHACGVPVLEGWGMTETTALGTVNTLANTRIGTVGQALPGVEFRIAEDGEILTRGPNVFREYWRNPEATGETLSADRWLATGDLGVMDGDGYLSITGRKKDIIITAGGKNLTPANLENDLKASRWISQAIMYADRRPYPVALITLDPEEMIPWARERGLPEDIPSLATRPEVRELIQTELDRANANYASVEQIKKFTLLDHDLSHEEGELTPTLKVKRQFVYERYADLFDQIYR